MRESDRWAAHTLRRMLLVGLSAWPQLTVAQSLIEGVDSWSEAVTARSSTWGGQRVDFPDPRARPESLGRLDSLVAPLSVHSASVRGSTRLPAVLERGEQAGEALRQSGLFSISGDGGLSGFQRDVYVGSFAHTGAFSDATGAAWGLDGTRAFVLLDDRIPEDRLAACVTQALLEAELLELDPAEAPSVRRGSAAYFTRLVLGETCDEAEPAEGARGSLHDAALFADWLTVLGARQDHNRGTFVQNMWHFARQRTWEGEGLRGSPDLLEAIARTLTLGHEQLEEVAGRLANQALLMRERERGDALRALPQVRWTALPAHRAPIEPPLWPLDSAYLLIDLEAPRPGEQLRVWVRGEAGVRWVLSATRLSAQAEPLGTLDAPVRKSPNGELTVELDEATRFVLVSLTNLADGTLDADRSSEPSARSARFIVDRVH